MNLTEYYKNNKEEINKIAREILESINYIKEDLEINDLTAIIAILAIQQHMLKK